MEMGLIASEFDQCIKCGLCLANCPVNHALFLEKYTPRGKIQLARRYGRNEATITDHYRDIFYKCLLCGACNVTCPSGVDLTEVFTHMRQEIFEKKGITPAMKPALDSLMTCHNISREDNEERGDWREDIVDLPDHGYRKQKAGLVYFVGCVASFFPMAQTIPQNMVQILSAADVDFTILAGDEWCCGFPLIGAGAKDKMDEFVAHNVEKVHSLGAENVAFSCPSCYRMWREHYPNDFNLLHTTQLIEQLIDKKALSFNELPWSVTYHDPCDLGRNGGEYDAPRKILGAIPGLELIEMENNRAGSVCCGGGGNLEMTDPALSGSLSKKRIEDIRKTGAEKVVTACQQCVRTLKSQTRREKLDLEVMDITTVVARALSNV
ncbi:MAG: (Fe-S)-binding protein [Deltaproteobacteria bacterium]|nr:(Fe-S)-binding protein [Deltaproteobacteria bacterium]